MTKKNKKKYIAKFCIEIPYEIIVIKLKQVENPILKKRKKNVKKEKNDLKKSE